MNDNLDKLIEEANQYLKTVSRFQKSSIYVEDIEQKSINNENNESKSVESELIKKTVNINSNGKKSEIEEDLFGNVTVKTIDILQYAGENKKGFKLAGFALESENEIENAKDKIKAKNLDIIVVNNPNVAGAGFGTNTNVITILDKEMNVFKYDKMSKFDAAMKILDSLVSIK